MYVVVGTYERFLLGYQLPTDLQVIFSLCRCTCSTFLTVLPKLAVLGGLACDRRAVTYCTAVDDLDGDSILGCRTEHRVPQALIEPIALVCNLVMLSDNWL